MDEFLRLRIELDRAITFGDDSLAYTTTENGLSLARQKELPAEEEYFSAQFFILKEDFSGALDHLDKAIALNPLDGAAFNDKALCLVELGQLDGALDNFDLGIAAEPDYATIYHNKGWLLNKLGRYSEAVRCFEMALMLEPGRAVTYENLGDTYMSLKLFDAAREAYKKALAFLPQGCDDIRVQIQGLLAKI